ncbi:MAG TPA: hypothetical protein VNV17_10995 [Solirubrobacteraceae bacterium]|nr:hypothetical protein [Solirubrobacteraceae bacterium]
MSEKPLAGAPGDSPDPAEPTVAAVPRAPRRHRALIATIFVLATVFGIAAVHAVWINRQALNTDNWTSTSTQLLANKQIQTAVAAYAVDQLFKSGVPQAKLKDALPTQLEPLAGPIASGLEQLAGRVAPRVLASSQVQALWRQANRAAHTTLLRIINGGGSLASTNGGVVTLNLHAIINQLSAALGVQPQVAAATAKLKANSGTVRAGAGQLGINLPPASGQLVVFRAKQLGTVQDIAKAIKGAALILPILSFALFALGVWLSEGRRRAAVRRTGWCFVFIGLFALLDRRLAGDDIVNALVKNPDNQPAAHQVWAIATTLLYDIAVAMIVYGLVIVVAAWVAGHTRPATALRRALAPTLRERPVAVYAAVYAALLLVILWGPTPATRQLPYIIGFIVLLALGVNGLRRQTAREFPEAQSGDIGRSARQWYASRGQSSDADRGSATPRRDDQHVAELERLSALHDHGSLTDDEFAAEKAILMNGS